MVPEREDCGHRRFPLLSGSRPTLSSPSPSRPGPLPRRPMVRPGADPGTPGTATPPTDRCETRLPSGPVPRPFLSATQKRPPNRRRPETPRTAIRRSSASSGGLGRSPRALRPLSGRRPPSALDALQRFADLYETGQIPEYHNTVDTILNWADEILNWHHSRRSNGPLEGTNNLIQTLRRTAHGFTNPQNYAARGLLLT